MRAAAGRRAAAAGLLAAAALLTGCAPGDAVPGTAGPAVVPAGDRALIDAYLQAANRAADAGPAAQAEFLRGTQDPAAPFPPPRCFGDLTLVTRIVDRTLRPDPGWAPPATAPGTGPPAGAVYVAAASATAQRDGIAVREDVGSKHFVVRDDRVFSYAPCAN